MSMVETISPVVHGTHRKRFFRTAALHVLGAGLAAATVGALLGALGAVLRAPWGPAGPVILAIVAVAYILRELGSVPVPIPDRHRQVPEWWRTFYSPGVAAFLYGLGLGVGFLTFLSFGTYVAVTVAALIGGSPLLGVIVCAPFGIARGLSVLVARPAFNAASDAEIVARIDDLGSRSGPSVVNALALAAVAVGALAAAL